MKNNVIVVRGGGDLASGVIHRLHRCGYEVLVLESARPSAIRRKVAFCEAVYEERAWVEGICARRISDPGECEAVWAAGEIPLLVDPDADAVSIVKPAAVIDAILAKRNLGTDRSMASLVIGLGPGFTAGEDVDYVVETMRGHDLGRMIDEGKALANTGTPGLIGGIGKERVIHANAAGRIRNQAHIADEVTEGQILAMIGDVPVKASITGILRGMIRDGYEVFEGMKIADIDPRKTEKKNCFTISDKARCIAGSVVEILLARGVLPV